MQRYLLTMLTLVIASCVVTSVASAGHGHYDRGARWYNANVSWHGAHYNPQWGRQAAVIVPPNAHFQTEYGWGVGRTRMKPIHHQFGRRVAPPGYASPSIPTPPWPWDTRQQGYYYVRGPW